MEAEVVVGAAFVFVESLVISPQKNLWHCLGACQSGGSVIDWVMRTDGVSFRHAVELLRDGVAPSSVAAEGRRVARSTVRRLPSPLERSADDRELLSRVVGFYERTLKESPEALGFLERWGLVHPELVERLSGTCRASGSGSRAGRCASGSVWATHR